MHVMTKERNDTQGRPVHRDQHRADRRRSSWRSRASGGSSSREQTRTVDVQAHRRPRRAAASATTCASAGSRSASSRTSRSRRRDRTRPGEPRRRRTDDAAAAAATAPRGRDGSAAGRRSPARRLQHRSCGEDARSSASRATVTGTACLNISDLGDRADGRGGELGAGRQAAARSTRCWRRSASMAPELKPIGRRRPRRRWSRRPARRRAQPRRRRSTSYKGAGEHLRDMLGDTKGDFRDTMANLKDVDRHDQGEAARRRWTSCERPAARRSCTSTMDDASSARSTDVKDDRCANAKRRCSAGRRKERDRRQQGQARRDDRVAEDRPATTSRPPASRSATAPGGCCTSRARARWRT